MNIRKTAAVALFFAAATAWAHAGHEMGAMPKEFDTMKSLVGSWEGTSKMEGKEVPVSAIYELTSGGSVITEKMGPGTEHEMINVYHRDGKNLAMTHYCAMGNQPHMILKKSDSKSMVFEMDKPIGVDSITEPHMHAMTVTMIDKDTMKQEWFNYADGKKQDSTVFFMKRKK